MLLKGHRHTSVAEKGSACCGALLGAVCPALSVFFQVSSSFFEDTSFFISAMK